jgi:hypothetical protein
VIRYSFLSSHERDKGAVEGSKDRPCAIVLAMRRVEGAGLQVVVAPITHSMPPDEDASVEIPASVSRALGLDDQRHWCVAKSSTGSYGRDTISEQGRMSLVVLIRYVATVSLRGSEKEDHRTAAKRLRSDHS